MTKRVQTWVGDALLCTYCRDAVQVVSPENLTGIFCMVAPEAYLGFQAVKTKVQPGAHACKIVAGCVSLVLVY